MTPAIAVETPTLDGYEAQLLIDVIAAKTRALTAETIAASPGVDRCMMAVLLAHQRCRAPLRVLDFGGACGFHHRVVAPLGIDLRWAVVETPAMVAAGAEFANDSLRFFSSIDAARVWLGGVDLVWSSGALQYADDADATLAAIVGIGAQSIVWTRMVAMTTGPAEVQPQTSRLADNGPGPLPAQFSDCQVVYSHRTIPIAPFVAAHVGYDLMATFGDPTGNVFVRS